MDVALDNDLPDRLSKRAEIAGFDSTEAYVNELLRTVLDELEEDRGQDDVEDRLEDLGYL